MNVSNMKLKKVIFVSLKSITMIRFLITLFSLFCIQSFCLADSKPQLKFESIDDRDGLPWNEVRRIHQDKEGFMWFSTYLGLVRYDGYEFKVYRNSIENGELLSSNFITTVADDNSKIWVGTNNGLNYISKSDYSFHKVELPSYKFGNTSIQKIVPIRDTVWIASSNGIMIYTENNGKANVEEKRLPNDIRMGKIESFLYDSKGRLWIGAESIGLLRYDFSSDSFIRYPEAECHDIAHSIYEDSEGNIWLGSWGKGLVQLIEGRIAAESQYRYFKNDPSDARSISSDIIYSIKEDRLSGDLWIGHRGGLSILKKEEIDRGLFDNYQYDGTENSLSSNDISDIFQSKDGTMWLATIGGGINRVFLKKTEITRLDISDITKNCHTSFITSLYKDKMDRLWIGLWNKGLAILDMKTGKWKHHTEIPEFSCLPPNSKPVNIAPVNGGSSLVMEVEGKGIYIIKLNGLKVSSVSHFILNKDNTTNNFTSFLQQDAQGNIWLSDKVNITITDSSFNLSGKDIIKSGNWQNVTSCIQDSDGNTWAATQKNGIMKISSEGNDFNITNYNLSSGKFNSDQATSLCIDDNDNIWAGSLGGGINVYNKETDSFECLNIQLNIPHADIFNIFKDNKGYIYACSHNSIVRILTLENNSYDIMEANLFPWHNVFHSKSAVCQIGDDTYAISGMNGISLVDTSLRKFRKKESSPIVITDIAIGYNSIYTKGCPSQCEFKNSSLVVNKSNNTFSVKFADLNFQNPGQTMYAYRLKGYDDKWIYSNPNERIANYTNIPKGRYCFEVRSSNAAGEWNDTPARLNIRVKPGIFEAWYSYIVYLMIALGILIMGIYFTRRKMAIKIRLDKAEMERNKNEELTRSKLSFFTNVSHEFLTPLTIIGCSIENLDKEDSKKIIQNNINKLRNLIKEIIDFNKAESKKLSLRVSNSNMSELIQAICENDFKVLAQNKNIDLSYDVPSTVKGWYDANIVDKVLTNLLSNAFKYNYENSFVKVSLREDFSEDNRYAIIEVKDGGVGITPDKLEHIFDRFYENDFRNTKKEGIGIGLALVKSLVELHKGKIEVKSVPGKGTDFILTLPINEGAYSENERKTDDIWQENTPVIQAEGKGKNILIVEDNPELRHVMCQYLSRYYVVDEAGNGKEAISKLEASYFDLVITDLMMPEMDGNELCRYIKNQVDYSETPVLMLTAKTSAQDKINAYDSGADAFMTKPFQMPLLVSRISNLLKGREQMKHNYSKGDDSIKVDTIAYTTLDEKFLEKATSLIEENISNEDFKLDDFVSEMNVSKSTLYRKINALTGMPCNEFIKDTRLRKAAILMKEKTASVSEIAYTVGFGQPKYFTYCFKKKFGMSPTEYMASHKK